MFALVAVPALAGLVIAAVGLLATRERLPRNRFAGVRTAATLRDEPTFRAANKIAGPPTAVAGLVGILGGLAGLLMPTPAGLVACVVVALAGMIGIALGAGLLAHRAALAMPKPAPGLPAGCAGCACGNCPVAARG